jgi:hypothetical protein
MSSPSPQQPPSSAEATATARIRPDWDTSITYDVLRGNDDTIPVFVGRLDLLQPLVALICETRKRGTILISGYRGTGKTTLLIEALRRAREVLEKPLSDAKGKQWRLLPIVLNVSEVSASLEQQKAEQSKLSIDPKRLLIALMRSFAYQRRRNTRFDDTEYQDVATQIDDLYTKTVAAEFSQVKEAGQEEIRARSSEAALSVRLEDFLKTAPYLTALAAVAFALLGWGPSPIVYQVLAAAAAVLTVALSITWKTSRTSSRTRAERFSYRFDNSLQQIENDLKDLLERLADKGFRTVVVLEELDKLDRAHGGEQLDAVIRYFKNLFTQAPALFFFVTDKSYFDAIATAIRTARQQRSYAVEHTFFSSRMFVGRPTTRDCLDYLKAILLEESDRAIVDRMYTSSRLATESHGAAAPQATPLSLFARVLLFRASNHLFDLKNELRRFVRQRNDGHVVLQFDAEMLPPEERSLAKFQDLIADKFRSFQIKGGRSYANEVLNDYLYSAFDQLGSTTPQAMHDVLPQAPTADGQVAETSDSLDITEGQRIKEAVDSLLEDLQRGLAVTVDPMARTFTWLANAGSVFALVRRLEKYEEELVQQLKRAAALVELVIPRLGADPAAERLRTFVKETRDRAAEVADLNVGILADAATHEQRELEKRIGTTLEAAYDAHRQQATILYRLAFSPTPLFSYEDGSRIWLLLTGDGDPRESRLPEMGCVLLAHGTHERIGEDAFGFARKFENVRRLALVHVLPPGTNQDQRMQMENRHAATAKTTKEKVGSDLPSRAMRIALRWRTFAHDEPADDPKASDAWGTMLGRELVVHSYWASYSDKTLARESSTWMPLVESLENGLDEAQGSHACFIEGARVEFISDVVQRVLQNDRTDSMPVPLVSSEDGRVVLDDRQCEALSHMLQMSTGAGQREGPSPEASYAGASRTLLKDPWAVLFMRGEIPLQHLDPSNAFRTNPRLVYLGPADPRRFSAIKTADVLLEPSGQFRTSSAVAGPGTPQHLIVRTGRYDVSPTPAAGATSAADGSMQAEMG